MNQALVMILAGGRGSRLMPLTRDRAKPAVPFGAQYRLIDFVLSNFVNSGFFRIVVLTQYKSQSLNRHLSRAWRLSRALDHYVEAVPAQQRTGLDWYKGSADAIYQNLNLLRDHAPPHVCIFGADHIYRMQVDHMLEMHEEREADLTIAAIPVPIEEASAFGVIVVDDDWRMVEFQEKPANPTPMPNDPTRALVSMGNYIFKTDTLTQRLVEDAASPHSAHDFGKDIIPDMLGRGDHLVVYDFSRNPLPGMTERERGYWRDVGSVASFYHANMDLVSVNPVMNLYNDEWPILTDYQNLPPAKFVHAAGDRVGTATESLVSTGCIISGGRISRSVLSPEVRVNSYSQVHGSILFNGVDVGRYAKVRNAIIDKWVEVPPGVEIGYDHALDRARGLTVTDEGIVVVPKGFIFDT